MHNRRIRLGLLTGGGDCPGLNAAIRAVVKYAQEQHGTEVVGIEQAFAGLVEPRTRPLTYETVRGIQAKGGTILGTTNRGDPYHWPGGDGAETDVSERVLENAAALGLDALIAIGGDGTLGIARRLDERGLPVIGIPKTIDGDVMGTDGTIGFDTARAICAEAIDRLETTAESHDRVMVLEVMGRTSGMLALEAALAGGADAVLVPEIPYDRDALADAVARRRRRGRTHGVMVVSEGAAPWGEEPPARARVPGRGEVLLGGAGKVAADAIAARLTTEVRVTTLGHLQRGGTPSASDRLLAVRFGAAAARLATAGVRSRLVALRGREVVDVPLAEMVGRKTLDPGGELVRVARAVGMRFGDERPEARA